MRADSPSARPARLSPPVARRLLWVAAYYAFLGAVAAVLWNTMPAVRQVILFDPGPDAAVTLDLSQSGARSAGLFRSDTGGRFSPTLLAGLAMTGALALALPVVWVYLITRRRKGFQQSLVHTLVMLPIAVSGILALVQNNIALAFSLAGIVALVRFRNTLDDTKDAVYIFIATGIGIAAAVGGLAIGAAMSLLFNVVVLALWFSDFGRAPLDVGEGGQSLAPAPAPAGRADGTDQDGAQELPRFNALLRVRATSAEPARRAVEAVLEEEAKRWELAHLGAGEDGRPTLDYRLRLRKRTTHGELADALRSRGAPHVVDVRVTSPEE